MLKLAFIKLDFDPVAQQVEQRPFKPWVVRSSRTRVTDEKPLFYDGGSLFLEPTNFLKSIQTYPNISLMGTQKVGTQKKMKNNEKLVWKTL